MKRYALLAAILAVLVITPGMEAQAPFPWPSTYVQNNVRDWYVNQGDESFALITQALTDMNASPSAPVRTAATLLRDRMAVAAKLIPEGGNVEAVAVYKTEFERIMAIVGGVATDQSTADIRAGFLQVLQAEFEAKP